MRLFHFVFIITIALSCTFDSYAQNDYGDSLTQSVLKSVKNLPGVPRNTFTKDFIDSLQLPPYAHINLQMIFDSVNKEIEAAKSAGDIRSLGKSYYKLSSIDSIKGNYKSAYENFKLYTLYQDSLRKKDAEKKELQLKMQQQQAQQQLEKEKEARKNTIRQLFLIAFLLVFITVSTSSFIAYKREKKAKGFVNEQKHELETTLLELKSTQQQLIQSEKMASLGELTAGIAHEIQNPLNFVNNFSEVNSELITELKIKNEELKIKDDEVNDLLNDLAANEEKINHHGKRADAIVKGMLQHSRQTKGMKEPTDINALCDEYLRLSYHGLRAKDKSFNADFKTDFDESIRMINIVPQDIGRVLLNLFNNAFYAVNEKQKAKSLLQEEYKPLVTVQTKSSFLLQTSEAIITISDNGNGISQNIIDKIFQPFFTTKPTGQGTGLGLSLAYDIITKEHNGTIKVESPLAGQAGKEGEGSKFIISLPVKE